MLVSGSKTPGSDEALGARDRDRVGAIARVELAEDAARVRLHGLLREQQSTGDLAAREPRGEETKDADLAIGEDLQPALGLVVVGVEALAEVAERGPRDDLARRKLPEEHARVVR